MQVTLHLRCVLISLALVFLGVCKLDVTGSDVGESPAVLCRLILRGFYQETEENSEWLDDSYDSVKTLLAKIQRFLLLRPQTLFA